MTATCQVTFPGEDQDQRGHLSLDYTGWISTSLQQGVLASFESRVAALEGPAESEGADAPPTPVAP